MKTGLVTTHSAALSETRVRAKRYKKRIELVSHTQLFSPRRKLVRVTFQNANMRLKSPAAKGFFCTIVGIVSQHSHNQTEGVCSASHKQRKQSFFLFLPLIVPINLIFVLSGCLWLKRLCGSKSEHICSEKNVFRAENHWRDFSRSLLIWISRCVNTMCLGGRSSVSHNAS